MWAYIIDGVFILLIVIFAIIGIAKGFVDSVLGLVSTGIALAVSVFCAKYVANFINKIFGLEDFLLEKLDGVNDGAVKFGNGTFELKNVEIAKFCVWIISVIALFLIIKIAISILAKIFEGVTKKSPTISGINRLLGCLFGLIRGAVMIVCLLTICSLVSDVPSIGASVTDKIKETKITNWSYNYVDDFVDKNLTQENIQDIVDRIISDNTSENDDNADTGSQPGGEQGGGNNEVAMRNQYTTE